MKKLLNLCIPLLLCGLLLVSCSSTEPVVETQIHEDTFANSQTIQQLKLINEELLNARPESRAWTNQQKKDVVEADIHGAYKGGKYGRPIGKLIGWFFGHPTIGEVTGALVGAVTAGAYSSWAAAPGTRFGKDVSDKECEEFMIACSYLINDDFTINRDVVLIDTTIFNPNPWVTPIIPDTAVNTIKLDRIDLVKGELHNILLALKDYQIGVDTTIMLPEHKCIQDSIYRSVELINECFSR